MKTIKIIIVYFLVSAMTALAQNPNLGTSGAQFLQIPVSARAEALGGAFVGLSDDASSVFWNPAGMVKVNNLQAHVSYMRWFDLFDFSAASLVYNAGEFGTFAGEVIMFTSDKMEITTERNPNGTGRYFDASDAMIGVSYAKYLTDRFSVGVTFKYVSQQIWNENSSGIAFDIGTQYRLDFQNLTIAMCMSNFGQNLKFDGPDLDLTHLKDGEFPNSRLVPGRLSTDEYTLPLNFQVGIGFDILAQEFLKLRGAIDVSHPNDNKERAHFGLEADYFDRFTVRGGYKVNYDDQDLTYGCGLNFPFSGNVVQLDYSYSVYDILPGVHRISINFSF